MPDVYRLDDSDSLDSSPPSWLFGDVAPTPAIECITIDDDDYEDVEAVTSVSASYANVPACKIESDDRLQRSDAASADLRTMPHNPVPTPAKKKQRQQRSTLEAGQRSSLFAEDTVFLGTENTSTIAIVVRKDKKD